MSVRLRVGGLFASGVAVLAVASSSAAPLPKAGGIGSVGSPGWRPTPASWQTAVWLPRPDAQMQQQLQLLMMRLQFTKQGSPTGPIATRTPNATITVPQPRYSVNVTPGMRYAGGGVTITGGGVTRGGSSGGGIGHGRGVTHIHGGGFKPLTSTGGSLVSGAPTSALNAGLKIVGGPTTTLEPFITPPDPVLPFALIPKRPADSLSAPLSPRNGPMPQPISTPPSVALPKPMEPLLPFDLLSPIDRARHDGVTPESAKPSVPVENNNLASPPLPPRPDTGLLLPLPQQHG